MPSLRSTEAPSWKTEARSLLEVYRQTFDVMRADGPELVMAAHRLRYEVFCVENRIFAIEDNPGEWERDEFDGHSVQALLRHKASGLIAGTVRLVLPIPGSSVGHLPIFKVCPELLRRPDIAPIEATAELGRFAISKRFRRRAGDGLYGQAYDPEELQGDMRRVIPHMSLGLISAALQIGKEHGIEHCCVVMEPSLQRLLTRFGIHFTAYGPPISYYGLRQPCYAEVTQLIASVEMERPDVWQVLTDDGRFWPRSFGRATSQA